MIGVMGLGFVGLTTALGFAHYGITVYGYDINPERANLLREGRLPFMEPEMQEILQQELGRHFFVSDSLEGAVSQSEIIFFCTGTPCDEEGRANLMYLLNALEVCIRNLDAGKTYTFVIKSTVPPTTTETKLIPFMESLGVNPGKDIFVADNPEFLREGHCWEDFIHADRIVIGDSHGAAGKILSEVYEPFGIPVYVVSYSTAEFIKYLSNSLLATMISFSNEMAELADDIGNINVKDAFRILHLDKRWDGCDMKNYVYPGCGYGGYCLPKDTQALYSLAWDRGVQTQILGSVIEVNRNRAAAIVRDIRKKVRTSERLGILGLSFKPDSDDVRDSAAARVIGELLQQGYEKVIAYDPVAIDRFQETYSFEIQYERDVDRLLENTDVLIIVTAWEEFRQIKENARQPVLDYRYM